MSTNRVTPRQIIARGFAQRCPNCGEGTLFPPKSLRVRPRCEVCGTGFDRGEGFFLGPWCVNYGVTAFGVVLPLVLLAASGAVPRIVAVVLLAIGVIVVPLWLYRLSWSWWLMLYFFFLPERLPANGGPVDETAED